MAVWNDGEKSAVGTNNVGGLDVSRSAHLLDDGALQESLNGWTEKDGEWSVARQPERLYSGSNIVAYEAGRMNGADHHVWIAGTTLYDNGTSKGTISGADSGTDIIAANDEFFIVGADKNYIYDGDHVRELGSPQADYLYSVNQSGTGYTAKTITGITAAEQAVISFSSSSYNVGDRVYISGISAGPTELNTNYFTVIAATSTTITIDADTSGLTAWSAGGTVAPLMDLDGDYKFYIVPCIRMSSGVVLSGKPRGLMIETSTLYPISHFDLGPTDQTEPSVLSLSAGDYVQIGQGHESPSEYCRLYFTKDGSQLFEISGTAGADYYRGMRIYRTKANGYDAYLEREYFEGDTDCSAFTDGTDAGIDVTVMYLGIPDRDLGALLDYGYNEHTNPVQSDVLAFAGQRAWVASGNTLYPSTLDGPEYFSSEGSIPILDSVTALGSWRDYCIIFSADKMWACRFIGGIPYLENIPSPVGTTYPKAVRETNIGLLFLRDDGLYLYSGGQPEKISREAFSDIYQPNGVVTAGDTLYLSGAEDAYVAINRGSRWIWHKSDHVYPYPSQTSGNLYAASSSLVMSLFTGSRSAGRMTTKKWGGFDHGASYRVDVDFSGDDIPAVWINGNAKSDTSSHQLTENYFFEDRRVLTCYVPRLRNQYIEVQFELVSDSKIYGVRIWRNR